MVETGVDAEAMVGGYVEMYIILLIHRIRYNVLLDYYQSQ